MKQVFLKAIAAWDGERVEHLIEVLEMFSEVLKYETNERKS